MQALTASAFHFPGTASAWVGDGGTGSFGRMPPPEAEFEIVGFPPRKPDPKPYIPVLLMGFPCPPADAVQVLERVGVWDRRPWEPAGPQRGERRQESPTSSAECLPSFPFSIQLAAIPVHPPSASPLSPIAAHSRPAAGLSSCGLTSVSVLQNLFSLPHVVPAAPDHTWGVTFGAETTPAQAASPWARHGGKRDASVRPLATGPSLAPGPRRT